jgi:hypothetical protein
MSQDRLLLEKITHPESLNTYGFPCHAELSCVREHGSRFEHLMLKNEVVISNSFVCFLHTYIPLNSGSI